MMTVTQRRGAVFGLTVTIAASMATVERAQERNTPRGEWRYQSGRCFGHSLLPARSGRTRATSKSCASPGFSAATTSAGPVHQLALHPVYVNGMLYSVAGQRRTVVAMDPKTGEVVWTYREPDTTRWQRSMRAGYGKGVAYSEIDGRGVIFITTPGFFLHAIDATTGQPLQNWGRQVPLARLPAKRRGGPRRGSHPGLGPVAEMGGRAGRNTIPTWASRESSVTSRVPRHRSSSTAW